MNYTNYTSYTINEIPNEATEAGNGDLGILWQDNKTKKISILNLFKNLVKKSEVTNTISATSESPITSKAVSSLLTISASSATITNAPPLQNGTTIRFFFTDQITGSDDTSALSILYNGTSYPVKATSNGALKNFTAYPIATEQTRNLAKGEKTEEEKGETKAETKGETKSGTRATVTTYVYCQAYTTLEMMFDGTQFIIMGNPVVISNSDYTVYTDGSITYTTYVVDRMRIAKDEQIPNIDEFRGLTAGVYISVASGGSTQGVCPSNYGVVICVEKEGYDLNYVWRFQIAFSTNGQLFFRYNINNAGWGEWKEL